MIENRRRTVCLVWTWPDAHLGGVARALTAWDDWSIADISEKEVLWANSILVNT